MRGIRGHVVWLLVVVVAIGLTWAAAWAVLRVPEAESTVPDRPTVVVEEGEVGRAANVVAEVRFLPGRVAPAGRGGTVTSVDVPAGAPIEAGSVLATIDMRPVVVMQGGVPAYRALQVEDRGPDVAQLRAHFGLSEGDRFDWEVERAVRALQQELGVSVDGVVALGDVLFLPQLPARGAPAEGVRVGAAVSAGADLYVTVEAAPQFLFSVDQVRTVVPGQQATVQLLDGTVLEGVVGQAVQGEGGLQMYAIVDGDGQPVCDAACAEQFSTEQDAQVPVTVEISEAATGAVVPNSAIGTAADGAAVVETVQGELIEISIVVQGEGVAVVEGVEVGTEIRLFGDAP